MSVLVLAVSGGDGNSALDLYASCRRESCIYNTSRDWMHTICQVLAAQPTNYLFAYSPVHFSQGLV